MQNNPKRKIMNFVRKILMSIVIGLLMSVFAFAQNGIPYITYMQTREGYEAENYAVCQDDQNAILFANKKGLLRYDGNTWSRLTLPGLPISIKQNPANNYVYVVSDKSYGYLKRDEVGTLTYVPLSFEGEITSSISNIYFKDSTILVYGEDLLSIHRANDDVLRARFASETYGKFSGVLVGPSEILVHISGKGYYKIAGDTLLQAGLAEFTKDEIIFSLPYDSKEVLLGTSTGSLLLFNGKIARPFPISNPEYLRENILEDGLVLTDSTLAFSTLYGGALIIRKVDGKVLYTLNYETGIPDDEIYAIGKDANGGLWLSYEFGTCRVDPSLPVKDFSHYPGIDGLLTNVTWYNSELYVSSTEGLYYLSEVKNYEEVEIYLKRESAQLTKKESREKNRQSMNDENVEKTGFLKRIFGRDRSKEQDKADVSSKEASASSTVPEYYKKRVSRLKSIDYIYKKIPGLNSRCGALYNTAEGLLVGSSSGLYLVEDHSARRILETRNVHFITGSGKEKEFFIGADNGVYKLIKEEDECLVSKEKEWDSEPAFSIRVKDSVTWISGFDKVLAIMTMRQDSSAIFRYEFNSVYPEEIYLSLIHDSIFLFSSTSVKFYSHESDSFLPYYKERMMPLDFSSLQYLNSYEGGTWLKVDKRIIPFEGGNRKNEFSSNIYGLFDNVNGFFSISSKKNLLVDDYSKIYFIEESGTIKRTNDFKLFVNYVSNESGGLFNPEALEFEPSEKLIRIGVSAPFYLKNQSTLYSFKIEEKMENWSKWSTNSELELYPEPGAYTIHIRAKNILDEISDPITVSFEVRTPFYRTTWFYFLFIPVLMTLFLLILTVREKKLKRDKRILEEKVQERTIEIQQQKKKIEIQKDEILAQKNDITSSITYASRIQQAILPDRKIFEKAFKGYFIFYMPRDIVSGDFYWISTMNDEVVFAAADCTGHGVPGAFMSMLGNSFLNEIAKESTSKLSAGQILDELRRKIMEALSQSGDNLDARDGMDIALCIYNKKKNQLEYSGAYNPMYLIRNGELAEFKADRMPIGHHPKKKNFRTQVIDIKSNDVLYLFSDGFQDQFGGLHGKKFTPGKFKQMLIDISDLSMQEQQDQLQQRLSYWQLNNEQVDDILVLGVRF